jgi:hypothetical protein
MGIVIIIIICCLIYLGIFLILIYRTPPSELPLYHLFIGLFFAALLADTYTTYKIASRYRKVIDVLRPNLVDIEILGPETLKITSTKYGEFYINYRFSGGDKPPSNYEIWIASDKTDPNADRSGMLLWERPVKLITGTWSYFESPPYVHHKKASEIKTLTQIALDWYGEYYRILATLTDRWPYSETDDLLKTLELLEEIYAGM